MTNEPTQPLDITLLHTFYEVARLGSVTAAARALGRSQPAISHRLRALEDELGAPLVEKIGRGLELTEAGRRVEARCADLMALCAGVRAAVAAGREAVEGLVRLGTFPALSSRLLAPMVAALAGEHADLRLEFVLGLGGPLLDALRSGRVDLVVLLGAADLHDLEVERVGTSGFVAVLPPAWAPSDPGPIRVEALSQRRYLAWNGPTDPTFERVQRFVETHGLVRGNTCQIPHIESLRELAAAGAGVTILPDYTVAADVAAGRLAARRVLGLDDELPLWLIGRRGQVVGAALRAVREAFRVGLRPPSPASRPGR